MTEDDHLEKKYLLRHSFCRIRQVLLSFLLLPLYHSTVNNMQTRPFCFHANQLRTPDANFFSLFIQSTNEQ